MLESTDDLKLQHSQSRWTSFGSREMLAEVQIPSGDQPEFLVSGAGLTPGIHPTNSRPECRPFSRFFLPVLGHYTAINFRAESFRDTTFRVGLEPNFNSYFKG